MIIKVCGMGDTGRMHQLAAMPIDMVGFIFYSKSPRYVIGKIDPSELTKLPDHILKAGVFVNAQKEDILKMATLYHLTVVQLHGNESAELCKELKEEGFIIIKAFNLTINNNYEAYVPYCQYFLFDTPSQMHGGTGEKFDWDLLNTYTGTTPFLLSGGIGPGDADSIFKINHPQFAGIDINSRFEFEPGVKDVELIRRFIKLTPQPPEGGEGNCN
jgi:phosphoribosylanthranilate isomerase